MPRRRTITQVDGSFEADIRTISRLLNGHMSYLRVDSDAYRKLAELNSQFVAVAKELNGDKLPWGGSSTGAAGPGLWELREREKDE